MSASDIDSLFARARASWERGDVVSAEAILRDLVARAPAREDIAHLLAQVLQAEARLTAASEVMFALCRSHAFAPDLSRRAALFIQQCHRQAIADDLCDRAIARGDPTPALLAVAGNIARELGDFAKARERYLAALDAGVDLDTWYVLGALAHTKRYADRNDPDIARFEVHVRDEKYAPRARAATGFGLAKAYDDLGDYESAARILRDANARVRSVLPWSVASWDAFVEARMNERVAHARAAKPDDFRPIFVVGLPRTGTTLTATRLAQHTGARDRGELRMLRFIAERLITGGHLGDADAIAEAAALYRVHARQDDGPAMCYIDQDPMNFRYLHFIEAMFPDARVIWCRRDRRDTALSIWSQDFAHHDAAFAYDFASTAAFAAGHDRLLGYWRATLSLPIRVLDYEAFVENPSAELDALSAFIDAPRGPSIPSTETTPIHSASVWQARQPIYAASVGRWRKYAPFVPELTELFV